MKLTLARIQLIGLILIVMMASFIAVKSDIEWLTFLGAIFFGWFGTLGFYDYLKETGFVKWMDEKWKWQT